MKKSTVTMLSLSLALILLLAFFSTQYITHSFSSLNLRSEEQIQRENDELATYYDGIVPAYYEDIQKQIDYENITEATFPDQYHTILASLYHHYALSSTNPFLGFGFLESDLTTTFYDDTQEHTFTMDFLDMGESRVNKEKIAFINADKSIHGYDALVNKAPQMVMYLYGYDYQKTVTYIDNKTELPYDVVENHHVNFFALQSFEVYASTLLNTYSDENTLYFITANDGKVYLENDETKDSTNFYAMLQEHNSDSKIDNFYTNLKEKQTSHERFTYNGRDYFFIASNALKDYNTYGIYVITAVTTDFVDAYYHNLKVSTVLFAIAVSIVFLVIFLVLGFLLISHQSSVLKRKYNDRNTRNYACLLNHSGKVLYRNKLLSDLDFENKIKTVYDFKLEETYKREIREYLNTSSKFVAEFIDDMGKTVYIGFVVLRLKDRYQLIGEDETKDLERRKLLENYSFKDEITNCQNARSLEVRLHDLLKSDELQRNYTLLVVDIRDFKNINYLYGHDFGNDVIRYQVNHIRDISPKVDEVYYLGGNSVGIFFESIGEENLKIKCHKMIDDFKKPVMIGYNEIELDISIGGYELKKEEYAYVTPRKIIENATIANMRSKQVQGRKVYIFDIGLYQTLERDSFMAEDLKKALPNHEFRVVYQPQYDVVLNKVVGFEQLLRWDNPKYKGESPQHYIELAEKSGLIHEIGEFISNETFRVASKVHDPDIHFSVNISPAQLLQAGFVQKFFKLYEKYSVPYERVSVEITETFLMTSFDEVIEKLNYLRSNGVKVYLDDFGTGYSSLLYLNDLPIDFIKIDKQFVDGIGTSKASRSIVARLISMAKDLDIGIVAEGVEEPIQVSFLAKNGCNVIQGWIISKAQNENKVPEMLKMQNDVLGSLKKK